MCLLLEFGCLILVLLACFLSMRVFVSFLFYLRSALAIVNNSVVLEIISCLITSLHVTLCPHDYCHRLELT